MDASDLCMMAAELVDNITETHGEDAVIRMGMVCVEIDDEDCTYFVHASSDDRRWVKLAFLDVVHDTIDVGYGASCDTEDED